MMACQQSYMNDMNGFVECSRGIKHKLDSVGETVELQFNFMMLKINQCLASNDINFCNNQVKDYISKINRELADNLN